MFRIFGKVELALLQYYRSIIVFIQQMQAIQEQFFAHLVLLYMLRKLKFALLNYLQIINQIDKLKKKELLKLVVKLTEMKNHKDLTVYGRMMMDQVLPLQELLVIFMDIGLVYLMSLKQKHGIQMLMMYLQLQGLMVYGMLLAVLKLLDLFQSKIYVI